MVFWFNVTLEAPFTLATTYCAVLGTTNWAGIESHAIIEAATRINNSDFRLVDGIFDGLAHLF